MTDFCRYDSPPWLGGLIANGMEVFEPGSIMDLGSGSGVLATEARARWPAATMVTVDLDRSTDTPPRGDERLEEASYAQAPRHVVADASRHWLHRRIRVAPASLDLAISNPPYSLVPWRSEFRTIMDRAGLGGALAAGHGVPLDVIFLAQALHMLCPGGRLAFVVPDSTISGIRFKMLRRLLIDSHGLHRVVQLPRRAFRGTDAQTFVIFLVKGGRSRHVRLDRVDADGRWSTPIFISPARGPDRLDYGNHGAPTLPARLQSLSELGVDISRGRACSRQVAASDGRIFHTGDFPQLTGSGVQLQGVDPATAAGPRYACSGDVLLARVDRRLEEKIAVVDQGVAEISDCVIRLRCSDGIRQRVLGGLVDEAGKAQIRRLSRGTGARHITLASIRTIRV